MRRYLCHFLTISLFAFSACGDDDTTGPAAIGELDKQFILLSADEALFQINAGQVAASGTTAKNISDYGEEMTDDHTKALRELQKLAGEKQVQVPTTLSDDRQQQLDSLSMQTGAALDTLYLSQMVGAHRRVTHALEIESTSGKDAGLKQWATNRLPTIRQFSERAQAMRDSIN